MIDERAFREKDGGAVVAFPKPYRPHAVDDTPTNEGDYPSDSPFQPEPPEAA